MTKMKSNIISTFYSDDLRLMAQVSTENDRLYVDFFKDDVLIGYQQIEDHSVFYAESMAENYTLGIIKVDPDTWRVDV